MASSFPPSSLHCPVTIAKSPPRITHLLAVKTDASLKVFPRLLSPSSSMHRWLVFTFHHLSLSDVRLRSNFPFLISFLFVSCSDEADSKQEITEKLIPDS